MNNIENFLNLVRENPTLPIVPMVDYKFVGDGWCRWMGSFGYSEVGEYALYDEHFFEYREDFKEIYFDKNEEEICERFNYDYRINKYMVNRGDFTREQLKANEESEKLVEEYLDKVAEEYFVKAIIVNISTP